MASNIRDKNGNFAPKTTLNIVKHHTRSRKYIIPFIVLAIAVGIYVVSRSFASNNGYSWRSCLPAANELCLIDSQEASVMRLYTAVLGRQADKSGLEYWSKKVSSGIKISTIADSFLSSSESKRKFGAPDNSSFIASLYSNILQRPVRQEEKDFWIKRLDNKQYTRGQIVAQFSESKEYRSKIDMQNAHLLQSLYNLKATDTNNRVEVATIQLAGKDSKGCLGKIVMSEETHEKTCRLTSTQNASGIFQHVAQIKNVTSLRGDLRIVIQGRNLENLKAGYLTDGGGLKLQHDIYHGDLTAIGSNFRFQTFYVTLDKDLTNGILQIWAKANYGGAIDIDNISITRSTESIDGSIPLSSMTFKNYSIGTAGGDERSTNPPYIDETFDTYECWLGNTYKPKTYNTCSASYIATFQPGTYFYTTMGQLSDRVKGNAVATKVDNNQVISENQAFALDAKINNVIRKYPLPINGKQTGVSPIVIKFTVTEPTNVRITEQFDLTVDPGYMALVSMGFGGHTGGANIRNQSYYPAGSIYSQ